MDNTSIHHVQEVVDLIESQAGAKVCFLPPYSPDLMPAEGVFSQVKSLLKQNHELFQVCADPHAYPTLAHRLPLESSRMAESKIVAVVPLNSTNYSTWKIQCKMALIKEGLWGIVNGTERAPTKNANQQARFAARRDKAIATVMLDIEPCLLYVIGADPTDPVKVWKAPADQFQRKTWANKLERKRKLFSMRLGEGCSMQDHIKSTTEVCDEQLVSTRAKHPASKYSDHPRSLFDTHSPRQPSITPASLAFSATQS